MSTLINPFSFGGGGTGTTWNSADKSSSMTLSNSDLTASGFDASLALYVRSVNSKTSGKHYFEITLDSVPNFHAAGIGNSSAVANSPGNSNSAVYRFDSIIRANSSNTTMPAVATNDVIRFAIDLDNNKFWSSVVGSNWNNSGSDDPATNTGGRSLSFLSTPVFVWFSTNNGATGTVTMNTGGSAFSGSIPSGFSAWG